MIEDLITSLVIKNKKRIILLVMDGVGGLQVGGQTELEAANTPNLDSLASDSSCGLMTLVSEGITPGSGPGHLSLFGYNPLKYQIGRGILEALGVDLDVQQGDLAVRGNFATLENGVIKDRRAGRIPTEKNKVLVEIIQNNIRQIEDVKVLIQSGKEHRFAVIFRGPDLNEGLSDADPQQDNQPPVPAKALNPKARKSEHIINRFIEMVTELLAQEKPANTVLMRGYSNYPPINHFEERYGLNAAAVATYPMYRGLARLVGMKTLHGGETIESAFLAAQKNYSSYDFLFVHVKKTDSMGEDGNFIEKVHEIEKVDKALPILLEMNPDVLAITGDHSTPAKLAAHSWHPTPLLIHGPYAIADYARRFTEKECSRGILGNIHATELMPLLLANSLRLKKYGA
ncbi:2,3-bisphosphoglycerate-independent phosphoglycerate mutase [bacterium]|nr:2,3-bisphosphoglycerate-independent phosphoglycerate mutase [bacterium]